MRFKKIFVLLLISISFLINPSVVLADHLQPRDGNACKQYLGTVPNGHCVKGYSCQPSQGRPDQYICQPDPFGENFGKIIPPDALKGFVSKDSTGAFGISQFLSNLIALFYSVAAIVLIFMLLWGAFEWMTSGGDKEKIESARRRIISAIIGIILFAVAFAVIQVLGVFTGFKFFEGQGFRGFTPGGGP